MASTSSNGGGQPQPIALTDLDLGQLVEVKNQLDEVHSPPSISLSSPFITNLNDTIVVSTTGINPPLQLLPTTAPGSSQIQSVPGQCPSYQSPKQRYHPSLSLSLFSPSTPPPPSSPPPRFPPRFLFFPPEGCTKLMCACVRACARVNVTPAPRSFRPFRANPAPKRARWILSNVKYS